MTRAAKITYTFALVIGLSAGFVLGFWNAALVLKTYYSGRRSVAPRALYDFSLIQYRHADQDHAKRAILTSIDLDEKLEEISPERGEEFMLTNSYIRLALLEDVTHNAQASDRYMMKAQHWYALAGGKPHSDSEMKSALKIADERLEQLGIQ